MKIKTGAARGQPLFFDLPALQLQPNRGAGRRWADRQAGPTPGGMRLRPDRAGWGFG